MKKKTTIKRITIQVRNTRALPGRAEATARLLRDLRGVFAELFSDENFITLLEAESRTTIPGYLRTTFEDADRHDIS
jgi:dTDP-4-dehydrorhamnose 3,5-epimerase-like enzyme